MGGEDTNIQLRGPKRKTLCVKSRSETGDIPRVAPREGWGAPGAHAQV
jgi:hypothetical protein